MDSRYNISELFRTAFGINSPIFITEPLEKRKTSVLDFSNIETIDNYHKAEAISALGTPIIGLLHFKGKQYNVYNHSGEVMPLDYQDYTLPATTLFMFRRSKNITKTNLLGSNGTVKEIFGFDDWIIDVKGFFLDDEDSSAFDKAREMLEWVSIAGSIEIRGKIFTGKEIFSIVIEDYRQDALQGSPGIIPYSMTLLSDEDVVLVTPEEN